LLYALRSALVRAEVRGKIEGYHGRYFFITSVNGHPCYAENASWLGLGSDACVKVHTDLAGRIEIDAARRAIEQNLSEGKVFLGFIATGGTTVELEVDEIKAVVALRNEIADAYHLNYQPWIHVDSVIGWAWLFFNGYRFDENPLNIDSVSLSRIKSMNNDICELVLADSFGIDFHKTGFCPYLSSLFMIKDRADFFRLGEKEKTIPLSEMTFGGYAPFEQTLELTRSGKGPIGALTSLKCFGKNGYRELIAKLTATTAEFRALLGQLPYVELLNETSRGIATLFFLKPPDYVDLTKSQILALARQETDIIKQYNLNYAKYVRERYECGTSGFILTASDVFTVRNTDVVIGMMKAYSLSVQADSAILAEIVRSIAALKEEFDTIDCSTLRSLTHKPVDMVYRK